MRMARMRMARMRMAIVTTSEQIVYCALEGLESGKSFWSIFFIT